MRSILLLSATVLLLLFVGIPTATAAAHPSSSDASLSYELPHLSMPSFGSSFRPLSGPVLDLPSTGSGVSGRERAELALNTATNVAVAGALMAIGGGITVLIGVPVMLLQSLTGGLVTIVVGAIFFTVGLIVNLVGRGAMLAARIDLGRYSDDEPDASGGDGGPVKLAPEPRVPVLEAVILRF